MTFTLHAGPGASSFAPHIVLEEIGEAYTLALMSPGQPEVRTAEFRSVNPKGRIPVLTADNFALTETPAILIHLGLHKPELGLFQTSGDRLVRSMEWFNWLSSAVHAVAVRMIWRTEHFSDAVDSHPEIAAKGRMHLLEAFALIESKLSGQAWAVGDQYSVVDPYLLVFYRWGNRMKIDMQDYASWTAHARHLESRDAVQRALAQEGISIWS